MNHCLPNRIVIFRDGTGDGDIGMVHSYEVVELKKAFAAFKDQDYSPKFSVIVVQKRINTRIFSMDRGDYDNPYPGTVVDHSVTRKKL